MKLHTSFVTLFFSLILSVSYSQNGLEAANKQYEKLAYSDAIKSYEKIAERGFKSVEIFQKLGNSYYFKSDFENAAKWYSQLFALGGNTSNEYHYRYAQSLKSIGNYKKSDEFMLKFAENSTDTRAKLFIENSDYLSKIENKTKRFSVELAGINTRYSDYGAAFLNNQIIFASARGGGIINRKHSWTDENFTTLYSAELRNDSLINAQKFDSKTSSKFHESTPIFTKDGKTMYYTRNNYLHGKRGTNAENVTLLQIYKSVLQTTKTGSQWSTPISLPFNSNQYSTAHPALNDDDSMLYFASDMPGTIGQSDIFAVTIHAKGSYGKPQNLGNTINTEARETFPFVSGNKLYFSSDGRPGLGGLDVYSSTFDKMTFSTPENLGSPINSGKDDFAFAFSDELNIGFISSNRDGGIGGDDIYQLKQLTTDCQQLVFGVVRNRLTNEVVANAKITFSSADFKQASSVETDAKGYYEIQVGCEQNFFVKIEKEGFVVEENPLQVAIQNKSTINFIIDENRQTIKLGDDLAIVLKLNPIYFDLDQSDIRADAALELQRIFQVLQENPQLNLKIRSHTDSRQTAKYNQQLSEKRAKATMNYLIQQGIASNRLSAQGLGETMLLNSCSDGVECTEEQHQLNRRSEFIVQASK